MMQQATTPTEISWRAYRQEFPIFERKTYFNTCSLGALSRRVAAAISTFTALWDASGAASWYGPWLDEMDTLRARFARLVNAEPGEIAIFPSVTAALTAVSSCFEYTSRPKVVISDLEFPTTVYQWLVKGPDGISLEMVRSSDRLTVPPAAYEHAIDEHTQLVVASHVYFTSGAIQDISAVARLAHAKGASCVIDAYQSVGQLPVDVRAAEVDFLVTGGLKWLLGGPGVAYLYVRGELLSRLQPKAVGWFAHRNQFAFDIDRFDYADDARRFEGGTPPVAAIYAGRAGLEIVHEIGVERLRDRQVELMQHLVEAAERRGLQPRIPEQVERLAGIVTIPRQDPKAVVGALARRHIIVDFRPGVIRLSPYFYNTVDDCEHTVAAIAELEQTGVR